MSYIVPSEFVTKMVDAGESKIFMSTRDTLIRAFMAGAILALAAVFAVTITVQTGSPLVGAMLFPVGFVMLYLMGFDLLTGVFVLTPLALLDKRPGVTVNGVPVGQAGCEGCPDGWTYYPDTNSIYFGDDVVPDRGDTIVLVPQSHGYSGLSTDAAAEPRRTRPTRSFGPVSRPARRPSEPPSGSTTCSIVPSWSRPFDARCDRCGVGSRSCGPSSRPMRVG